MILYIYTYIVYIHDEDTVDEANQESLIVMNRVMNNAKCAVIRNYIYIPWKTRKYNTRQTVSP